MQLDKVINGVLRPLTLMKRITVGALDRIPIYFALYKIIKLLFITVSLEYLK